ncbi:unnamed protein product [Durusdinium trenchii]
MESRLARLEATVQQLPRGTIQRAELSEAATLIAASVSSAMQERLNSLEDRVEAIAAEASASSTFPWAFEDSGLQRAAVRDISVGSGRTRLVASLKRGWKKLLCHMAHDEQMRVFWRIVAQGPLTVASE